MSQRLSSAAFWEFGVPYKFSLLVSDDVAEVNRVLTWLKLLWDSWTAASAQTGAWRKGVCRKSPMVWIPVQRVPRQSKHGLGHECFAALEAFTHVVCTQDLLAHVSCVRRLSVSPSPRRTQRHCVAWLSSYLPVSLTMFDAFCLARDVLCDWNKKHEKLSV